MDDKILVTGASGQLGALAVDALLKRLPASQVAAQVRREEAAAPLRAKGVDVRIADYDDPASLVSALQGIGRVLLISGNDFSKRAVQHANVIEAAKTAGVGYLAYTSVLKADTSKLAVAPDHVATEAVLAKAGVPYGVLRNGWYTENYAASAPAAVEHGALIGAAGAAKISSAARADYAEAAAALLTQEAPENGVVYELAGSETFTLADFAKAISAVAGKDIPYVDMSEAEYTKALEGAGLPTPVAELLATSDTAAKDGDLEGSDTDLVKLIGRPSTPVRDVIKAAL